MTYNLTNLTGSNNLAEIYVNSLQIIPAAGIFVLISVMIVVFIGVKTMMNMERSLLITTFFGMIFGWFFYFISMISLEVFKIVIALFLIALMVNIFSRGD